ncbi:hypothetical protein [Streptomyces sp. NRRL S-237]|uniref:hypothetical protein n=1 Tax=Streptomyces sp. NRRL S-237 TaxID=1463895 RepID=UPI0004C7E5E9|nr:hypothetical protein [Streptomyces sp. NRRL S-237]
MIKNLLRRGLSALALAALPLLAVAPVSRAVPGHHPPAASGPVFTATALGAPGASGARAAVKRAAGAASGNWYFASAGSLAQGSKTTWTPRVSCDLGPCTYSTGRRLEARALNEAAFVTEEGSSFDLVKGSSGAWVGSCVLDGSTRIVCAPNAGGAVASGDDLRIAGNLILLAPASSCIAAADLTWYEDTGAPDRDQADGASDDMLTLVTSGRCA